MTRDPRTPTEWQDAVDAAEACLLIESARIYGLVTGGPTVQVTRCEHLLAQGRARQIVPTRAGVDAHLTAIVTGGVSRGTSPPAGGLAESHGGD